MISSTTSGTHSNNGLRKLNSKMVTEDIYFIMNRIFNGTHSQHNKDVDESVPELIYQITHPVDLSRRTNNKDIKDNELGEDDKSWWINLNYIYVINDGMYRCSTIAIDHIYIDLSRKKRSDGSNVTNYGKT